MGFQKKNRLIPYVIEKCLRNESFDIKSADLIRDFCFVEDVMNGILKVLGNKKCLGEKINIASGEPRKVREIVEIIIDKIKLGNPKFKNITTTIPQNKELYANISKIKKLTDWFPIINIDDGLSKTINWYENNGQ